MFRTTTARTMPKPVELSNVELGAVSGGVFTEVHHNPQYKEPTVLLDDGLNIRTSGLGHSNVGYDSPFTPIA